MQAYFRLYSFCLTGLFLSVWASHAAAHHTVSPFNMKRDAVNTFIEDCANRTSLSVTHITKHIKEARYQPRIIELISTPAEKTKPWHEYRQIFLTEQRISEGAAFMHAHRDALFNIEQATGVPAKFITAIIGVETYYGKLSGGFKVLDALSTLGLNYPPRSTFFAKELCEFLVLAHDQSFEPNEVLGSYAGAMGVAQFMPSSYRAYARDGDADQRVDLWGSWPDAFASIAHYFLAHKWQTERNTEPLMIIASATTDNAKTLGDKASKLMPYQSLAAQGFVTKAKLAPDALVLPLKYEGVAGTEYWLGMPNFYTITRYNRSTMYARAVIELADAIHASYQTSLE